MSRAPTRRILCWSLLISHIIMWFSIQQASTPPSSIFGNEPPHGCVLLYEKAELARQQGNWPVVEKLGDDALNQGLYPLRPNRMDAFLQSYAVLGELDKVHHLSASLMPIPFRKCRLPNPNSYQYENGPLSTNMQSLIQQSFCQLNYDHYFVFRPLYDPVVRTLKPVFEKHRMDWVSLKSASDWRKRLIEITPVSSMARSAAMTLYGTRAEACAPR